VALLTVLLILSRLQTMPGFRSWRSTLAGVKRSTRVCVANRQFPQHFGIRHAHLLQRASIEWIAIRAASSNRTQRDVCTISNERGVPPLHDSATPMKRLFSGDVHRSESVIRKPTAGTRRRCSAGIRCRPEQA
jgi:hypothetical protein